MPNILVITVGRAGSTNLCVGLSKTLNLKFIDEPFSPVHSPEVHELNKLNIKNLNNSVVKHIWWHTPNKIPYLVFLRELIKNFDSTFILTRKDSKEHFESLVNLKYRTQKKDDVFTKYVFEDIPNKFIEEYKNIVDIDKLKIHNSNLLAFAKENNIKVGYYEDIYSDDINRNLDSVRDILNYAPSSLKKFLDNKNRQRIFNRYSRVV